tara:strand:- start:3790 stop:4197 length:408 start_codon:yes stop_codon:yes gene_type:complete
MAGFKLPKDLEVIANEHGLSKGEVEQFANKHNVTGLTRGGGAPTKASSPDDMMAQAYASNTAVTSDRRFYADKKDAAADRKERKIHGEGGLMDKLHAAEPGSGRAKRLENRIARKQGAIDRKRKKAKNIRTGPHY